MFSRDIWLNKIKALWEKAPIVWLSGVRRVGKTTLIKELDDCNYLNCDLPSVRRKLSDIELFYDSVAAPIVLFDEIHQLEDPSLVLKIGADAYRNIKILATGSSTLAATQKFSDSLTGRKRNIHLVPVLAEELETFGIKDIERRLLQGGLPDALMADEVDLGFYSEWIDSYYARDVSELFKIEKRAGFLRLFEFLILNNGGMLEMNTMSKYSGLSFPTVKNYMQAMEITHVISVIRPFHGGGKREIVKQPKCYAFDTGFVSYVNGWKNLRPSDRGLLFENLVLESLQAKKGVNKIFFWRDKSQKEIDFVCPASDGNVDIIECKWSVEAFDVHAFKVFRESYPKGRNFVIIPQRQAGYSANYSGIRVDFLSVYDLAKVFG